MTKTNTGHIHSGEVCTIDYYISKYEFETKKRAVTFNTADGRSIHIGTKEYDDIKNCRLFLFWLLGEGEIISLDKI